MARLLALKFLLILLAAGVFSPCPGQEAESDSTRIPVSYEHWYDATHPSVEFTLNKEKDVTNWDARIALVQPFGQKFNVRLNAVLSNRSNSTLNRADANDGTTASLSYALNDDLSFSANYNSTVLANWYDLNGGAPDDRKKRGSFTVASDYNKQLTGGMGVRVHVGGGATQNSYSDLSNSGNQGDIGASVTYNPAGSNFRASADYTGKQIFLTSRVDSAGFLVLETQDKTFSQNLTFDTAFDVFPGLRVAANLLANDEQKQRPDQVAQEQETELRKRRGVSVNTSYRLTEGFTWDATVNLSRAKSRFKVREDRNSDVNNAVINGSLKVIPWGGASVNVGGKWGDTRSVYITADTGNNIQKSVSFKYAQKVGPKADFNVSALSDLATIEYDNKMANPKDRDLLSNRVSADFGYKLRPRINLGLGGEISRERSVYTQSEQSGNNKDIERYRITGSYDIKTWQKVGLNQRYEISSVFTEYHFDDTRNTLVRNSSISTSVDFKIVRALGLNVRHNYKYQDQGGYRKENGERLYAQATESESHLLNIALNYRVGRYLNFRIRQGFFTDTRWRYEDGMKILDYVVQNTDISGRVGFDYKISETSEVAFFVEHNRKEGDRVNEAFRDYWNAEIRAKHIF
jgi:hypothetical protein